MMDVVKDTVAELRSREASYAKQLETMPVHGKRFEKLTGMLDQVRKELHEAEGVVVETVAEEAVKPKRKPRKKKEEAEAVEPAKRMPLVTLVFHPVPARDGMLSVKVEDEAKMFEADVPYRLGPLLQILWKEKRDVTFRGFGRSVRRDVKKRSGFELFPDTDPHVYVPGANEGMWGYYPLDVYMRRTQA